MSRVLKNRRQISITVIGRRSGRAITVPVWFVFEENALWLLPVYGSETQWYRNLRADPAITIRAGSERRTLRARAVKEPRAVRKVIRWFRQKYTPEEIARWYRGLDAAVKVAVGRAAAPRTIARRRPAR